jgi:hypothetical protein
MSKGPLPSTGEEIVLQLTARRNNHEHIKRWATTSSICGLKYRLALTKSHAHTRESRDVSRRVRLQHNQVRIHPGRQTAFVSRESEPLRGRSRECCQYLMPVEYAAKLAIFQRSGQYH